MSLQSIYYFRCFTIFIIFTNQPWSTKFVFCDKMKSFNTKVITDFYKIKYVNVK